MARWVGPKLDDTWPVSSATGTALFRYITYTVGLVASVGERLWLRSSAKYLNGDRRPLTIYREQQVVAEHGWTGASASESAW